MNKNDIKRIGEILKEGKLTFSRYPQDALVCITGFDWITLELTKYFKEVNEKFDEGEFLKSIEE